MVMIYDKQKIVKLIWYTIYSVKTGIEKWQSYLE